MRLTFRVNILFLLKQNGIIVPVIGDTYVLGAEITIVSCLGYFGDSLKKNPCFQVPCMLIALIIIHVSMALNPWDPGTII